MTRRKYQLPDGIEGFDSDTLASLDVDESTMSAGGILATTTRDREGDVLEVAGIQLANHKRNPVVLLDHGLYHPLPVGVTRSPAGDYTVQIAAGVCRQRTYFAATLHSEQLFALIAQGVVRANSIGYRPIWQEPLPPDLEQGFRQREDGSPAGWRILECELIECSWVGIPANPDAVRATLSRDRIEGKRLAPAIKAMLERSTTPGKVWSPGWSPDGEGEQWTDEEARPILELMKQNGERLAELARTLNTLSWRK